MNGPALRILIFLLPVALLAGMDSNAFMTRPYCADLLLAQPRKRLSADDRAWLIYDINSAIARLRADFQGRPKNLGLNEDLTDQDVKGMSDEQFKYYSMSRTIRAYEELVAQVGIDQIDPDLNLDVVQLVGQAEIQAYFSKLRAGESFGVFEPVLNRLRNRGSSRVAKYFEHLEVKWRRWWSKRFRRTDFRLLLLYPKRNEAELLLRGLESFWKFELGLSHSREWYSTTLITQEFFEVFQPSPDWGRLGWNGRDDLEQFKKSRTEQIIETQIRFDCGVTEVLRSESDLELAAKYHDWERTGYNLRFDFIPGFRVSDSGARQPVLTVVTRATRPGAAKTRRPPKAAASAQRDEALSGQLSPAL